MGRDGPREHLKLATRCVSRNRNRAMGREVGFFRVVFILRPHVRLNVCINTMHRQCSQRPEEDVGPLELELQVYFPHSGLHHC